MGDDKIPNAVASSEMEILGHKITVYVLDDGRRVVSAEDMEKFLNLLNSRNGHDDLEACEVCSRKLTEGDLVHRCADGPILCEACAPTWNDVLAQYNEPQGDFGAFAEKSSEEMQEDRQAAQDRVDAGDGEKKHVWPL